MRLFQWAKDGGPNSPVDGFFLIELKRLFSVVILRFNKGEREAFHNHAFNAYTWMLCGDMVEVEPCGKLTPYKRAFKPKLTPKTKMHRVIALADSWAISIRGPWSDNWQEYDEQRDITTCFVSGRFPVWKVKGKHY